MTLNHVAADTTTILLIRHGETAWNAERRLQGHLDIALNAEGALSLLEAEASSNMDESARIRQIEAAHERLFAYRPAIEAFAHQRGEALSHDHLRLTEAAGGGATVKVTPVLPADIIGLYVLLPEVN